MKPKITRSWQLRVLNVSLVLAFFVINSAPNNAVQNKPSYPNGQTIVF